MPEKNPYSVLTNYEIRHLSAHLVFSGHQEAVEKIICSYDWLREKLERTNVNLLINDFSFLRNNQSAQIIAEALRLSSHVLMYDKSQLSGQLIGRLLWSSNENDEVKSILSQARKTRQGFWLRPLTTSLIPPGKKLVRSFKIDSGFLNDVVVTPDCKLIVASTSNGEIIIWDFLSGSVYCKLKSHQGSVNSINITMDGRRLVSGGDDEILRIWDINKCQEISSLKGHMGGINDIIMTPNGHYMITGADDATVRLWDLRTFQQVACVQGHKDSVRALAISDDGRYVASGSDDNTLKIWNIHDLENVGSYQCKFNVSPESLIFTSDGCLLIAGLSIRSILFYDLKTEQATYAPTERSHIQSMSLTSNNRYLVFSTEFGPIEVWDIHYGKELPQIEGCTSVMSMYFSKNDQLLISGSRYGAVKVWDFSTNRIKKEEKMAHDESVMDIVISSDGLFAVSASSDETIKVWDLNQLSEVKVLRGHSGPVKSIGITPNCSHVISGSYDNSAKIWDLSTGQEVRNIIHPAMSVPSVKVTRDGNYILFSNMKESRVWNINEDKEVCCLDGCKHVVNAIIISEDNKIFSYSVGSKSVDVWELNSGKKIKTIGDHNSNVEAIVMGSDPFYLIMASSDHTIKIWDIHTGQVIRQIRTQKENIRSMRLSKDNRLLVSCSERNLKVWDFINYKLLTSFSGEEIITSFDLCSSGENTIVAGEVSGRMHFLKLEGG